LNDEWPCLVHSSIGDRVVRFEAAVVAAKGIPYGSVPRDDALSATVGVAICFRETCMHLLFGHGYLGSRIARLWRRAGRQVLVVTRNPAKSQFLRTEGFGTVVADICDPASLAAIPSDLLAQVETVVFAVGYERDKAGAAERSIHDIYAGGVRNVMDLLMRCDKERIQSAQAGSMDIFWEKATLIPRFIYISSTGVYGDAEGAWVDEKSECRPAREGGRACLAAEEAIRTHWVGSHSVILRLAGIYGPGRIPRVESLKRYEPIDAPADGFLNLIHVDDAARIVLEVERTATGTSMRRPRVYNVADGNPGLRREYYTELARLVGVPKPVFVDPAVGSPAAARAAADKRISNRRLCEEIGATFLYPSYREGLAAIVAAERASNK
jgi:nucleoside-diphosphate-sugar epimerase